MTQPLSPAAQAIDEIIANLYDKPVRCVVAAALCAVADEVEPDDGVSVEIRQILNKLLAIAAELEGQTLPQPPTQPTTEPC